MFCVCLNTVSKNHDFFHEQLSPMARSQLTVGESKNTPCLATTPCTTTTNKSGSDRREGWEMEIGTWSKGGKEMQLYLLSAYPCAVLCLITWPVVELYSTTW